ncbi:MAG: hypothetical protein HYY04_02360 [Chloroflexi bacterium]|nr:hypothetical protein [Chloroflexota bacterium]
MRRRLHEVCTPRVLACETLTVGRPDRRGTELNAVPRPTPLWRIARNPKMCDGEDIPHIRVVPDPVGETLTVYWAELQAEQICKETGGGVTLIKDARTHGAIGF